jgi:predicted ATPase
MHVENPNLFVISGGPGAGKTTLLDELAKLGFRYAPEVARQIIQEQVRTGGTALPWADRAAYIGLMLQRSIESFEEHTPAPGPLFADRGIPDTLAYARVIGLANTRAIEDACRRYRYASVVFLAPPWREIYRTDSERKQDFAEGERTYGGLWETYEECGYRLIELPKLEPIARARFVCEHLELAPPNAARHEAQS